MKQAPIAPAASWSAVERGLLRVGVLLRFGLADGQKGQAVDAVDGVLVLEVDRQHLADLRQAALLRAFDLVRLAQRRLRVHGGLHFAAGGGVDILRELDRILDVESAGRVRGWQVLPGLGRGGTGKREQGGGRSDGQHGNGAASRIHEPSDATLSGVRNRPRQCSKKYIERADVRCIGRSPSLRRR